MTNEEQWELYGYCCSVGLTPMQGKIVVLLKQYEGLTIDELQYALFRSERPRYSPADPDRINIKVQMSHIRKRGEASTGIRLEWDDVRRPDAYGRIKHWRRHRVVIARLPVLRLFEDWQPPGSVKVHKTMKTVRVRAT